MLSRQTRHFAEHDPFRVQHLSVLESHLRLCSQIRSLEPGHQAEAVGHERSLLCNDSGEEPTR